MSIGRYKNGFNLRVFKNKWFDKFCKKQKITNAKLIELINNIENGLVDVDYGGSLIKQRLARNNQGSSGGYRSIILYKLNDKAFFVYGFAKNDRDNITKDEESSFKDLAKEMLNLDEQTLNKLVLNKILIEVKYDYN